MRKDQTYHYFKTEEVNLLRIIEQDIRTTIKCNKLNEIPHQRAQEWAAYLAIINRKREE